jgi:hypothetical protein
MAQQCSDDVSTAPGLPHWRLCGQWKAVRGVERRSSYVDGVPQDEYVRYSTQDTTQRGDLYVWIDDTAFECWAYVQYYQCSVYVHLPLAVSGDTLLADGLHVPPDTSSDSSVVTTARLVEDSLYFVNTYTRIFGNDSPCTTAVDERTSVMVRNSEDLSSRSKRMSCMLRVYDWTLYAFKLWWD